MVEEIEGIAEATGAPFGKILFMNFVYEMTTIKACSGILVRNSTGHILHGRNMDVFIKLYLFFINNTIKTSISFFICLYFLN